MEDIYESVLTNRSFCIKPYSNENKKFSTVKEIASPEKIVRCCRYNHQFNNFFEYRDSYFYYSRINNGNFSNFFVIYEVTSLFDIIDFNDPFDIDKWLKIHWDKPILITTDIEFDNDVYYTNTNTELYNCTLIQDPYSPLEIIQSRGYTIANGLILLLGLHRAGILNERLIYMALYRFIQEHRDFYQKVTEKWFYLFYDHPTSHIADLPWYYICSGPNFTSWNIIELFMDYRFNYDPFPQPNYEGNQIAMTSYSCMYPNLHRKLWDSIYHETDWSDYNFHRDYFGFLQAVTKNRRNWKWFRNKPHMIDELLNDDVLKFLFHLYKNPKRSIYVRRIWKLIINNSTVLQRSLFVMIIKQQLNPEESPTVPIEFYRDVFKYNRNSIKLFDKMRYRVNSRYNLIVQNIYSDAIIYPNRTIIDKSIYDIIKTGKHRFYCDIENYIIKKLICLRRIISKYCNDDDTYLIFYQISLLYKSNPYLLL